MVWSGDERVWRVFRGEPCRCEEDIEECIRKCDFKVLILNNCDRLERMRVAYEKMIVVCNSVCGGEEERISQ